MPLLTYENIIPQRREIVKRLAAVFKKYFGDFFVWAAGAFFASLIFYPSDAHYAHACVMCAHA